MRLFSPIFALPLALGPLQHYVSIVVPQVYGLNVAKM
jgi:hypothetical protein